MTPPVKLADLLGGHIQRPMDTKGDHQFLTECADSRYLRAHLPESELLGFHNWRQSGRKALDFPWSEEAMALIDVEIGVLVRLRDLMAETRANVFNPSLLAEADRMRKDRSGASGIGQVRQVHHDMMAGGEFQDPQAEVEKAAEGIGSFPESVEESQAAMMRYIRAVGAAAPLLAPDYGGATAEQFAAATQVVGEALRKESRDNLDSFTSSIHPPSPLYKITLLGTTMHTGLPGEAATRMLNIMRDGQAGANRPVWPTAIPMTDDERGEWVDGIMWEGIHMRKALGCEDGYLPPDFVERMASQLTADRPFCPYTLYEDMAETLALYHGITLDAARLLVARLEAGEGEDVFAVSTFTDI